MVDLADQNELAAISECILNVLVGNVKLGKSQKSKLTKHKNIMRLIARKNLSSKRKKSILKQKGGFLPAILPLAISALTSLVPALLGLKK